MNLVFELLSSDLDRSDFSCGENALDVYFKRQAGQDMKRGFATVVVAKDKNDLSKILGYYTICAYSVEITTFPSEIIKKMPRYPYVPALLLGRLAVSKEVQGKHIGSLLVYDAMKRSCRSDLAWAFMIVDAKNISLCSFYERFMFARFSENSYKMWINIKQVKKILAWKTMLSSCDSTHPL
ncbi:MAG: GNAT family N-acetyltransferase [Desulfovibrio sp.]|nr:GNAT family N-acetyltransferase [Desulfovibrio sp.]